MAENHENWTFHPRNSGSFERNSQFSPGAPLKVEDLLEENRRMSDNILDLNEKILTLHAKLFEKDEEIAEKVRENEELREKLAQTSREMSANGQLSELMADNQASFETIMRQTHENNELREKLAFISQENSDFREKLRDFEALARKCADYERKLRDLLENNEKLQTRCRELVENSQRNSENFEAEIARKSFLLEETQKIIRASNQHVAQLELEVRDLKENLLENEEKKLGIEQKLKEIAGFSLVVEDLNRLVTEKVAENNELREKNLQNQQLFEAQRKDLERLVGFVAPLNEIISKLSRNQALNATIIEEIKLFGEYLRDLLGVRGEFRLDHDNAREKLNEFREIFKEMRTTLGDFKEKLYNLLVLNENLNNILEDSDKKPRKASKNHDFLEKTVENLKKKLVLILEENKKLNEAFEKVEKTRVFKSWSESREKIETVSLKNELEKAKRNILLLLRNNKDLLGKFQEKQTKKPAFYSKTQGNQETYGDVDEKVQLLLKENKEKYTFQINSLKKQIEILKDMNKNRGVLIENLLKKMKNDKI